MDFNRTNFSYVTLQQQEVIIVVPRNDSFVPLITNSQRFGPGCFPGICFSHHKCRKGSSAKERLRNMAPGTY